MKGIIQFCDEEKESEMKLSLDRVCYRTATLTGIRRPSAQRIMLERKHALEEQQQPKQRQKCRWMTLIRMGYGEPSSSFSPEGLMLNFKHVFIFQASLMLYVISKNTIFIVCLCEICFSFICSRKKPYIPNVSK